MIDVKDFRELVIRPTLEGIKLWSPAAENLLLGTAVQESRLTYLDQIGGGPAVGLFQMEPATYHDIWNNWLKSRPMKNRKARRFAAESNIPGATRPSPEQMIWNLRFATAMCRLHYYRAPFKMPEDPEDIGYLARIWKQFYNTPRGAGTEQEFVENWERYVHAHELQPAIC